MEEKKTTVWVISRHCWNRGFSPKVATIEINRVDYGWKVDEKVVAELFSRFEKGETSFNDMANGKKAAHCAIEMEEEDIETISLKESKAVNAATNGNQNGGNSGQNAGKKDKKATSTLSSAAVLSPHNYIGLQNQGATCALNSLLQVLFMTDEIRQTIFSLCNHLQKGTPSLLLALGRLFHQMMPKEQESNYYYPPKAASTRHFTQALGWSSYKTFEDQDAHELFTELLAKLQEAWPSDIPDLFACFKSTVLDFVQCLHCNAENGHPTVFLALPLAMKAFDQRKLFGSIKDSLSAFIQSETISDFPCQHCGQEAQVEKGYRITELAPILVLHLNRFQYTGQRRTKFSEKMSFPIDELANFSSFVHYPDGQQFECPPQHYYQLFAVVVHSGSVSGGHYYAYIRESEEPQDWYWFNDSSVTLVTSAHVVSTFGEAWSSSGHYTSTSGSYANMLFYKKVDRVVKQPIAAVEQQQPFESATTRNVTVRQGGDGFGQLAETIIEMPTTTPRTTTNFGRIWKMLDRMLSLLNYLCTH